MTWELYKMKTKFYWTTIMLIYLCIVYACFHTIVAELNTCNLSTYHRNNINLQKVSTKLQKIYRQWEVQTGVLRGIFLSKDNYFMEKEKLNWRLKAWLDGKAVVLNCLGNLLKWKFPGSHTQKLLFSRSSVERGICMFNKFSKWFSRKWKLGCIRKV